MTTTNGIVAKLWSLCNILRDDGVTYNEYVTELTYLLFLKMLEETKKEERVEVVGKLKAAFAWINRIASEATSARKLIDHLDQAFLTKAFRGELVPQDPSDEPASVLLERIRAERAVRRGGARQPDRKFHARTMIRLAAYVRN